MTTIFSEIIERQPIDLNEPAPPFAEILKNFDRLVLKKTLVSFAFLVLGLVQGVSLVLFFPILVKNFFFAFGIALLLMTLFAYLMVRQFLQAGTEEQMQALVNRFIEQCEGDAEENWEQHSATAVSCCKLANLLHGREFGYYKPAKGFGFLKPSLEKLSCFLHWEDLHLLKEQLLKAAIEEHLKLVRSEPTSLEVHAALANAYVMLSGLYLHPDKIGNSDSDQWIPSGKYSHEMQQRFREAAERAIEEFKILKEYAPNDPWVYTQLAYSYRDLNMPAEEMKAYETIVNLRPYDYETRFKLGVLYFQEGENARGLKVYQELKKAQFKKAEMLMIYYGSQGRGR